MDSPASIESLAREVQALRDKLALAEGREAALADEVARHLRTINTLVGPDSSHERMRQVIEGFSETAEGAVLAFETRNAGGMQVPYMGDFKGVPPSVVGQLRRWAREFRAAIGSEVSRG